MQIFPLTSEKTLGTEKSSWCYFIWWVLLLYIVTYYGRLQTTVSLHWVYNNIIKLKKFNNISAFSPGCLFLSLYFCIFCYAYFLLLELLTAPWIKLNYFLASYTPRGLFSAYISTITYGLIAPDILSRVWASEPDTIFLKVDI